MGWRAERILDLPVIHAVVDGPFSLEADYPLLRAQIREMLNAETNPVYYIIDLRRYTINVQDLMIGANLATRTPDSNFLHPNTEQVIIIATSSLIKRLARGMRSPMYGSLDVPVFDTMEEAMSYIYHCEWSIIG